MVGWLRLVGLLVKYFFFLTFRDGWLIDWYFHWGRNQQAVATMALVTKMAMMVKSVTRGELVVG